MISVVLADDQALVRAGIAALLGMEDDIEVVAQAVDASSAVAAVAEYQPDVAMLDIEMGDSSGLDAAEQIHEQYPKTQCLIVTTFGRPGYLTRAMAAGVSGFIVKDAPGDRLIEAVRRVARGLRVIDPELATEAMVLGPNPLTLREREVLVAAGQGGTVADIAKTVCLAEGTVRNHLSTCMAKLGARTRLEAFQRATEVGWL